MVAKGLLSIPHVYFILFSVLAFAALQNVTVDDAVVTGPVVPIYLPAASDWNQGNACSVCLVQPDPSLAYDGTWHDGRFDPNSTIELAFEFTFVGSGLYIYFILANTVPNVTTLTNITFVLDGVQVSSFKHSPSTSTDFEYNQTVYANDSIPYGQHTMMVVPVNDSVNSVLILFDYFIYTTDSNTSLAPSPSPSPTSPSGPNVGAIVGGVVGGLTVLLLVTSSVIFYRRHKRRSSSPSSAEARVVEPFVLSYETAPSSSQGVTFPIQRIPIRSPSAEPGPTHQPSNTAPSATVLPAKPSSTPTRSSSNAAHSSGTVQILEQVGMLRDEVARLRRHQDLGLNASRRGSEPPPQYS